MENLKYNNPQVYTKSFPVENVKTYNKLILSFILGIFLLIGMGNISASLVLGTNCGFVTVAPTDDPGNHTSYDIGGQARVIRHTSPVGSTKITEIGWYISAGEETNYEIGLYSANGTIVPGEAETLLYVSRTQLAGDTIPGWEHVSVDWNISENTVYWIAIQIDNAFSDISGTYANSGGEGQDAKVGTTLPNPFGGGAISDADAMEGIYAVYETTPDVTPSSHIIFKGTSHITLKELLRLIFRI